MTTIAFHYGHQQIAVDGRRTCDDIICTDTADKIIINKLGTWVMCGAPSDYADLVKLSHNDPVDPMPACLAFLIKDGKVFRVGVTDGRCWHSEQTYNAALGSGGDFALAAMDHGKTALEAVEYAMTRDVYTGGKIRVVDVGDPSHKPKGD